MRDYNKGILTESGDRQADFKPDTKIPKSLIKEVAENFNDNLEEIGSVKTEMVDVLIFSESIENSVRVSVERPDVEGIEEFSLELEKRILHKIQWCFAMKGFKFNNEAK